MVVSQDGNLDNIGLGVSVGVLLGTSGSRPVVESDWDVVSEILLACTKYQASNLQVIVTHFDEFWGCLFEFHSGVITVPQLVCW